MNTESIRNFVNTYINSRSTLFWLHQKRELKKYSEFFDTIESHPLTELQRRAVILNERRNLVVAGAGTGKTSVITAKAGYLVQSGKVAPDDILLLAFNDLAAKELEERCNEKLGLNIKAKTFHSLGKEILDKVEARQSVVSNLATNEKEFDALLVSFIIDLKNNPKHWKELKSFIIGKLKPYKHEDDFKTLLAYKSYIKSVELRALSGDLVKSFAELDIANFLYMKGVNFEYEKRYKVRGVKYEPDFHLTDYDIYLEHFGIDREGNTAPYINAQNYSKQIKWKRELHKENGTKLIETYSWQRFEGTLLQDLTVLLRSNGVQYDQRPDDEIFKAMIDQKYTNQIGNLIKVFLTHFKSNHSDIRQIKQKASTLADDGRAEKFLDLFALFYERYERELNMRGKEIDFNDMIAKASGYIADGSFKPPWKYVIVDEFQDISVDRYKLIEGLLKADKKTNFFAVGDDWQSINRFAGSDISIMSNFRKFFGSAAIVNLDRTFRFNDKIAELSGRFIQQNPNQLKKNLVTHCHEEAPQVYLHHQPSKGKTEKTIEAILTGIKKRQKIKDESILILARYNHLLNKNTLQKVLKEHWPGTAIEPQSIHKSKGKEADYVIVLGLDSSQYGFPSEIADDPLLSLVLAEPDEYPHSEERRLFYVAVTRAKKQVHLIYDERNPSVFVTELIDENYEINYEKMEDRIVEICPECKSGELIDNGVAYACSNYPYCTYEAPLCPTCGQQHLMYTQDSEVYKCANSECDSVAELCPECGIGALLKKKGKYGDFYACHIWPRCSYTKNN